MTAPFCALCCDDIVGEPYIEPIGRDDADVTLCSSCATEIPRAYDATRGYESSGGLPGVRNVRVALKRYAESVDAQDGNNNRTPMITKTPGFVLVRVAITDRHGKTRDAREARFSLRGEKWHKELRHLGSTTMSNGVGWHLFERPPIVKLKHEIAPARAGRTG